MRLRQVVLNSLKALAKKGLLKVAMACNLEFSECCVLDKKTKVKFGIATHRSEGLLDCVHIDVEVLRRLYRLEVINTLSLLLIIYLSVAEYTL